MAPLPHPSAPYPSPDDVRAIAFTGDVGCTAARIADRGPADNAQASWVKLGREGRLAQRTTLYGRAADTGHPAHAAVAS